MKEINVPQSIIKEIKEKIPNLAILYLTGSRLTGTQNNKSDYDFYAFTVSHKSEFVLRDRNKGTTYKGDNYEIKCFDITHLFALLRKTNPNFIELFFNVPIFVGGYFDILTRLIYRDREKLPYINEKHFVASSVGMIKSNLSRISPNKVYKGSGSFGKELFNLIKAYRYGLAVANGKSLEAEINIMNEYLYVKNTEVYDQNLLNKINPEYLYQCLKEKCDDMKDSTEKLDLLNEYIYNTPLYFK
ncbi:DNA polymerase beta superfamily protein [Liquorilactobacillus hordei]|uniref:Nucleotidyltransferase n=1 Tax=Liquorilactobacillus hordei DSM 19519 TaxID=1423759 RepID=A0A0R1MJ00_9LACO|nr:nucleotidyltransferase domain-containing protein [Liquorilactobacillus hordei]KRL07968.1 hypothetical protein FC92_GL001037 [Liquorilactobacillus hordei DSM 19519]QYH51088.1 hypothetical protein G6O70_00570 [Liquorilactobacillus hordei DSM 19519]